MPAMVVAPAQAPAAADPAAMMSQMMMLQMMQQMQNMNNSSNSNLLTAPTTPTTASGGDNKLMLDVVVRWEYCGSHRPVEERSWDDQKFRLLVTSTDNAESIAKQAISKVDLGEFQIVDWEVETSEGFKISLTDKVDLVSARYHADPPFIPSC